MKTAIIEKYDTLGGTCLNVGCIPSKALLDSSEHYHNAPAHSFEKHGIGVSGLSVDFSAMIARKAGVVKQTTDGINFLMKKNKIDVYHGHGSFESRNTIAIAKTDGKTDKIEADKVIIATGSKPASLPFITIDKNVLSPVQRLCHWTNFPKA